MSVVALKRVEHQVADSAQRVKRIEIVALDLVSVIERVEMAKLAMFFQNIVLRFGPTPQHRRDAIGIGIVKRIKQFTKLIEIGRHYFTSPSIARKSSVPASPSNS